MGTGKMEKASRVAMNVGSGRILGWLEPLVIGDWGMKYGWWKGKARVQRNVDMMLEGYSIVKGYVSLRTVLYNTLYKFK